jgi:hypothetical protein
MYLSQGERIFSVAPGWDDTRPAFHLQRFDKAQVEIEGFIRQQSIGLHARQQRVLPLGFPFSRKARSQYRAAEHLHGGQHLVSGDLTHQHAQRRVAGREATP